MHVDYILHFVIVQNQGLNDYYSTFVLDAVVLCSDDRNLTLLRGFVVNVSAARFASTINCGVKMCLGLPDKTKQIYCFKWRILSIINLFHP